MKLFASVLLFFLLTINTSFAKDTLHVGFGYQYGGAIGAKYNFKNEQDNYYASIGLLGGALGYQFLSGTDEKHAFGIMTGAEVLSSERGFVALTYNYYGKGFSNDGWVLGISAGLRRTDGDPIDVSGLFGNESETETKALIGINVGFTFD